MNILLGLSGSGAFLNLVVLTVSSKDKDGMGTDRQTDHQVYAEEGRSECGTLSLPVAEGNNCTNLIASTCNEFPCFLFITLASWICYGLTCYDIFRLTSCFRHAGQTQSFAIQCLAW